MSLWNVAWIAWAGVAFLSFLGLEIAAIVTRGPRSTLSAYLRRWLGIEPHRPWAVAGAAVFAGFLAWLAIHIIFGVLPGV